MHKFETPNSNTSVNRNELNELIARLSNPHCSEKNGSVTVRDIAETMDIDEVEVIHELAQLRERRQAQQVPQDAEKLGVALDQMKTSGFKPVSIKPFFRISFASVLLIAGLVFGIFVIVMLVIPRNGMTTDIHRATKTMTSGKG